MLSLLSLSIVVLHKFWACLVYYSFKCCSSPFPFLLGCTLMATAASLLCYPFLCCCLSLNIAQFFVCLGLVWFLIKTSALHTMEGTQGKEKTSQSWERGRTCLKYDILQILNYLSEVTSDLQSRTIAHIHFLQLPQMPMLVQYNSIVQCNGNTMSKHRHWLL